MQIPILIALGVFFLTSILLLILYHRTKDKYDNTVQELKQTTSKFEKLHEKLEKFKDELSTKKQGYYQSSTTLAAKSDSTTGDVYKYLIYIKELDRYTNGMSKIEIVDFEMLSGYDPAKYDWVKTCAKGNFVSIKKTSDIEWLESEESIKEMRKHKLEKLGNVETDK